MAKVRELSDQLKIAKVENSQLRKRLTSLQGVAAGEVEGAAGPIPTPPAMTSVLGSIRKQLTDSSVTGSTMPHASKKRLWREAGEIVTAPGRKEEGSTLRPRADLAAPSPPKRLHIQKPTATSVALENSENSGPDNCAATTTVDGNCDGGDKAPRVAGSVARSRNRFAESRQRRRNREQQEAGDEGTNQQQQQQCAMQ
ncbi:hypothetical protein EV182_008466 [Spiromyces aspiralis]|uniref:Uncharacterized protein n=1 Tax=Spiromyces aspiralis TaxID=68401 RepID=A0ACC1HCV9_9FUNG|nr:hypothetical protein EV182_008466 [Spiromyces aspiralis]